MMQKREGALRLGTADLGRSGGKGLGAADSEDRCLLKDSGLARILF